MQRTVARDASLNTTLRTLFAGLRQREDSEHVQALIRIGFGLGISTYLYSTVGPRLDIHVVCIGFEILSVAIFIAILLRPARSALRRGFGTVVDLVRATIAAVVEPGEDRTDHVVDVEEVAHRVEVPDLHARRSASSISYWAEAGKPVPLAMAKGRNFRAALILEPSGRAMDIGYTTRRTVYGYIDRSDLPEVFNSFDFANPDMSNGRRHETTVPQQALYLMNSPLVVEQARNVVDRSDVKSCRTEEAKIRRLYEIIFQRLPRPEEIKLAMEFIEEAETPADSAPAVAASEPVRPGKGRMRETFKARQEARLAARKAGVRNMKPIEAWAEYAHALLLANEAGFVN